jgi:mono/diheme cytochrome c family protein
MKQFIFRCPSPRISLVLAVLIIANVNGVVFAQAVQKKSVDFNRQVRPILARHCFSCHGPDKAESGLRLSDPDFLTNAADSGEHAIVAGDPAASQLLTRVKSEEDGVRMPPEGKRISEKDMAVLETWIREGADYQRHWSFQPIQRPAIPALANSTWSRTPIDQFILARLEAAELKPAPQADPRHLIRRAYYNVLGIPPSPEQVEEFVANSSDQDYENLVDQLLSDPRMGERWGRHWLDIVRYAETNSYERDGDKPNAWRYRDYVIQSLNADKPYDQFVREQIAGDELDQVTNESLTATGFYRLGVWDDEPADRVLAKFDEYDDLVTTTGHAFLGLTINCARCHDHKIDPITQKDYYQFVALVRDVPSYGASNQIDISPPEVAAQYDALTAQLQKLKQEMEEIEKVGIVKMSAEDQRATEGGGRKKVLKEKLKQNLDADQWDAYTKLQQQSQQSQKQLESLPPRTNVMGLARCDVNPPPTFILRRGNPQSEGEQVEPGFPELVGAAPPVMPPQPAGARSAGRRRELANWIVSDKNWFTARVIVNRIWQHHFGRGLVRSANNFGQLGDQPTHPELIDWLASELIRNDWQLKSIHRLIMLSSVYQMSSQSNPAALQQDPENNLFWRYNMRRLSAEEIRDGVLATTGQINFEKYGPSIYPELGEEVKATQSVPGKGWGNSSPSDQSRRSVYIFIKRSLIPPELSNFDFPETDSSCEARFLTTQPAQALNMLNGQFMQRQSTKLAARVRQDLPDQLDRQIAKIVELALCRPSNDNDLEIAHDVIRTMQEKYHLNDERALSMYCLVVLNLNEFIYLD